MSDQRRRMGESRTEFTEEEMILQEGKAGVGSKCSLPAQSLILNPRPLVVSPPNTHGKRREQLLL
jgi:hypothetical protein